MVPYNRNVDYTATIGAIKALKSGEILDHHVVVNGIQPVNLLMGTTAPSDPWSDTMPEKSPFILELSL